MAGFSASRYVTPAHRGVWVAASPAPGARGRLRALASADSHDDRYMRYAPAMEKRRGVQYTDLPVSPAERCWSGRTGLPAKQLHPKRVSGVRIPPSPPFRKLTSQMSS